MLRSPLFTIFTMDGTSSRDSWKDRRSDGDRPDRSRQRSMWRQDCRMYATASCWSRRSRLAHFIARSIWSEATSSTKRTAGWLSGKQITEDDASSK